MPTTMMSSLWLPLLVSLLLTPLGFAQDVIQPVNFYNGLVNGTFDLVMDVRTQGEWDAGHIENATFVKNLASADVIPDTIKGCEAECQVIVVYCQSGNRAGTAISLMLANGFNGTIYNGLGVGKWTNAGYPLVNTSSVPAPCALSNGRRNSNCHSLPETEAPTTGAPVTSAPTTGAPVTSAPTGSSAPTVSPAPTPGTIGGVPPATPSPTAPPGQTIGEGQEATGAPVTSAPTTGAPVTSAPSGTASPTVSPAPTPRTIGGGPPVTPNPTASPGQTIGQGQEANEPEDGTSSGVTAAAATWMTLAMSGCILLVMI